MKFLVRDFKSRPTIHMEEDVSPEDLDIDVGVMHFPENLSLNATASKSGNDLTVEVHIEGDCEYTCSLCLEEFNNLFEKDITLHYDIKGLDSVTIDQDVREEIILEHPIRILCKPDCRGLCTFCGANLNHEKCDCSQKE